MDAVILAGGLGTRLRPFTEVIPKPLLPIGEQSLMEVQVEGLRKCGFDRVFVATNYKSDYIEAYMGDGSRLGVKLQYSREQKPLGTCGPLSLLRDELSKPFVVMNGDIITKMNFGDFYEFGVQHDSLLTLGTKIITTPFRFGSVQVDENDYVVGIDEKPELHFEILAGVYFFKPSVFDLIPNDTYYGMDDLIHDMRTRSLPISRYLIKEYWLDIGQVEDYSQARQDFSEHFS